MQNWSRLILPLGLGLTAAGINAAAVRNRLEPLQVVSAVNEIAPGQRLQERDLQPVDVPANSGNRRHFWPWSERQRLLGGVTSAVSLKPGELIPRDVFLRDSQPRFLIPEDHVVVSLRLPEDAVQRELRYRLRPGRPVSVKLNHEDQPLRDVQLAFMELVAGEKSAKQPLATNHYQIGLTIRRDPKLVQLIVEKGVESLATTAE